MKRLKIAIIIPILATLFSCNRTDFSKPEEVLKGYRTLSAENKSEILYNDFISSKSKEYVTKDEFVKAKTMPDSIRNSTKILESNISSIPIDVNNPTYRRYKVDEKYIFKTDTLYGCYYYTLINENGKWKVIWPGTLLDLASNQYSNGNYSAERKTLEKAIEIEPFSGRAYNMLAWSYLRDNSLSHSEWDNGVVKNAKYAITLEEDNPENYNTLASYYSEIGNNDLAIQNLERGLSFCQNKEDKITFYSNLASSYLTVQNFNKGEDYIKKSIEINNKNAFVWFIYGNLMMAQNNYLQAKEYYEKALEQDKMENALQGKLYFAYAYCCSYNKNNEKALDYVNKALDIEPDNKAYQFLYNQIKNNENHE